MNLNTRAAKQKCAEPASCAMLPGQGAAPGKGHRPGRGQPASVLEWSAGVDSPVRAWAVPSQDGAELDDMEDSKGGRWEIREHEPFNLYSAPPRARS